MQDPSIIIEQLRAELASEKQRSFAAAKNFRHTLNERESRIATLEEQIKMDHLARPTIVKDTTSQNTWLRAEIDDLKSKVAQEHAIRRRSCSRASLHVQLLQRELEAAHGHLKAAGLMAVGGAPPVGYGGVPPQVMTQLKELRLFFVEKSRMQAENDQLKAEIASCSKTHDQQRIQLLKELSVLRESLTAVVEQRDAAQRQLKAVTN